MKKKINLISFHGLYSQGNNLDILVDRLRREAELNDIDIITAQHDYPKLNATMGYFRWARDVVRDYILKCLSLEYYRYPDRELIVICHSNATWGISRAIGKYFNSFDGTPIKVSKIVLFGSTIKRNYDWGRYPVDVINFVGTKDRVVWLSKMFKMGWSGRRGFKVKADNLTEIVNPWKHSDFVLPENFEVIQEEIFRGI